MPGSLVSRHRGCHDGKAPLRVEAHLLGLLKNRRPSLCCSTCEVAPARRHTANRPRLGTNSADELPVRKLTTRSASASRVARSALVSTPTVRSRRGSMLRTSSNAWSASRSPVAWETRTIVARGLAAKDVASSRSRWRMFSGWPIETSGTDVSPGRSISERLGRRDDVSRREMVSRVTLLPLPASARETAQMASRSACCCSGVGGTERTNVPPVLGCPSGPSSGPGKGWYATPPEGELMVSTRGKRGS
eukprot:scaffold32301_cov135-Isochrysis_galbana.AAC.19